MITIDLKIPMTVTVADAAKVEHTYELKAGLNDVPPEVASHWYVKKFAQPVRRVPRVMVPSSARPGALARAAAAKARKGGAPVAPAPVKAAAEPVAEAGIRDPEKAKA
jgi:hypothetical protein